MKKIISILKYIGVFILVILIFNIGLFLTCNFNSNKIEKKVIESYNILRQEDSSYRVSRIFNVWNNNYTDAVIINESYSVDNKHPFLSYMKVRKNYKKGLTQHELPESTGEGISVNYNYETGEEIYEYDYDSIGELYDFINGNIHYSVNYGRYWHGYLILFRPLLLICNISEIRAILHISFVLLLLLFVFLVYKRFNISIALIYGLSIITCGYLTASYSLESSSVFLIMIISSIIYIKRIDKMKNFNIFIFIVGCITNYFDYLTIPLITLGVLSSLYMLKLLEEKKDWKYCLKELIIGSLLWLIGYAGTWIFKWIQYDLTINDVNNMLKIGFVQSFYRMERVNDIVGDSSIIYRTIDLIGVASFYSLIITFIIMIINKFKMFSNSINKNAIPFLLIALYPVVWYIVLANHTLIHYYFTYRHTIIFTLGICLFTYEQLFNSSKR